MGQPPEQPYWQQPEGEPQYVPQPPPYFAQQYPQQYPGYGYPVPAGPRVSDPPLGWLTLGGALLAVLAGVLPWASVFGVSIYNADGDGGLVIGCAVIAGACGIAIGIGKGRLWASITATVFGLLIGLIGLVDTVNVNTIASGPDVPPGFAPVSVGAGLWLTIVAGLLITGLGAVAIVRRRPANAPR
jgi:hypothetical protein